MSHYPQPPYQQPPVDFNYYRPAGAADTLAPARRASVLMFVMGGLIILFAGCLGLFAAVLPSITLPPEQAQVLAELESQLHGFTISTVFAIYAGFLAAVAIAFFILAVFVRRGGRVAIGLSIALSALAVLYLAGNMIAALFSAAAGGVMGACVTLVPLALFVLLITWLFQAWRAGPQAQLLAQQQQAQMWQYQQQQPYVAPPYGGQSPAPAPPYGGQPPPAAQPPAAPPSGYGYGYRPPPSAQPPNGTEGPDRKDPYGPST